MGDRGKERVVKDILLIARALDFSARKHANQRRKGEAAEPYVNHVAEVARLLAEATGGRDAVLVAAGLLHDTVEDTETTPAELEAAFGRDVADLVVEVTDDKALPRARRKALQIENAPKKSAQAKMLKLADKTSNLRSVVESPPANWSIERRREYFDWAQQVAAGCRGVNAELERAFDTAWEDGIRALGTG